MPVSIEGAISQIHLSGYRSIKKSNLQFENINVFIGANASGKSNFMSFFQMLQFYLNNAEGLAEYVGRHGGSEILLFYGPKETNSIIADLYFQTAKGVNRYQVELEQAAGGNLFFKEEQLCFSSSNIAAPANLFSLGSGGKSSRLLQIGQQDPEYAHYFKTIHTIKSIMRQWKFYQFHDTSANSFIRRPSHKDDSSYLKSNGGNLPSFLSMLRDEYNPNYEFIIDMMREIFPFIQEIILESDYSSDYVNLRWTEKGHPSYIMQASQMSDGAIRALAIIALLSQPHLPPLLCIDEPELGLHPQAISIIGDLIKAVAHRSQVIISTQSTELVDCFDPEDIVIVNRGKDGTDFERLDHNRYKSWLDNYGISASWKTNIFGGQP